jgi:signal transduction histidine kinase
MTILGFFLALLAGFFVSRRILQPIREMTATARKIEVENMDKRIVVPPARDELSELAQTFNHMLDRLEGGFEQQKRFVSDASHELRTPVTVILGYSDLLSRWGRADEAVLDEGISSIRSEAENMQQLIEKLLFLARADQNRQVLHKENIELSELLEDIMRKMQLVTKNHSVELLQNDDGMMYGDLVTVRQMFRIFLDNSTKYTPQGGRITVKSERVENEDGLFMQVALADNGIGIDKKDQQKVFERFYRVDTSRTKAQGVSGTGLGLSIASWIAQQHDIEIRLESELGKGTTIYLQIPLVS